MERSEPALAPEWLKAPNRSSSGTINSSHLQLGSASHSDDLGTVSSLRGISRSSSFTVRSSSSTYRRSNSSNGTLNRDKDKDNYTYSRPYSSFGRNHRDRDRERDTDHHNVREKSSLLDNGRYGFSDPFTAVKSEKDLLLRSPPMLSRKRPESCPKRTVENPRNGVRSIGSLAAGFPKTSFEKDFPSLGAEEKLGALDIIRVSSPGLPTAAQSLALGSSAIIGSETWTSALVDVPPVRAGNAPNPLSVQPSATASSASSASNTGLNMAETLAQAPLRARTDPQLSVETRKLEELAMKQSRQLIPVTPSMPKMLVNNSLDKLKPKGLRNGDTTVSPKVVLQSSSQHVNHTLRGPVRSDPPKTSQGNFHVLNRERNGISPTSNELPSPFNGGKALNPLGFAPASVKNDNALKPKTESKTNYYPVIQGSALDKKPSSQAQNRNAFFNALRKKTIPNCSSAIDQEQCSDSPISVPDKLDEQTSIDAASILDENETPASDSEHPEANYNGSNGSCNSDNFEMFMPLKDENDILCSDAIIPDEEEAQFLRSLGWEEDTGEEALTPEEIYAFYKEHEKLITASKLRHLEIRQ